MVSRLTRLNYNWRDGIFKDGDAQRTNRIRLPRKKERYPQLPRPSAWQLLSGLCLVASFLVGGQVVPAAPRAKSLPGMSCLARRSLSRASSRLVAGCLGRCRFSRSMISSAGKSLRISASFPVASHSPLRGSLCCRS